VVESALLSSSGGDNADGSLAVSARVGLVVIAAVCGVLLTSLAWLGVICCLQRRHELASDSTSSTSTDETVVVTTAAAAAVTDVSTIDSLQRCVRLLPAGTDGG